MNEPRNELSDTLDEIRRLQAADHAEEKCREERRGIPRYAEGPILYPRGDSLARFER